MTYPDALAWLYATQLTGIKLGLETVHRLLDALEFDSRAVKIIHVAGTNGKGSTCAMLDAVCRAQGYRTGLYTSPHLVSFRERIQLDGRPIPEAAVADGLTHLRELTANWMPTPTFFEFTTALALDWLRRQHTEVIVVETGLGGRLDATNAVWPAVSVLTAIDYDHTAWLGDTLALIAGEKAGIIKPGVPVVSAPQDPEAAEVIARTARERGSVLHVVADPLPVGLAAGAGGQPPASQRRPRARRPARGGHRHERGRAPRRVWRRWIGRGASSGSKTGVSSSTARTTRPPPGVSPIPGTRSTAITTRPR